MSTAEALQLMLEFGGFVLSLLSLIIVLIKLNDKKK
ncbi:MULTISPECIES: putative holin-like toxin [Streptococcus]|uniref:Holin n=1 Tax=Streptococcus suis TaxID=1307 RepID=A0AAD0L2K7_STRSU|nr:putative holin-like toxin [Streptococcus suis]AWX96418.1 holin [Streptococcus suis]AWX98418.1 holin [Streptococcus suis]MBS8056592.1 putative holin-like toxin [Streptococcus suis]MCL4942178.1 putative holin-like toxin [Streptococcus suis]MDX4991524.1 putative holin-like toxin [Streptococcus suis]